MAADGAVVARIGHRMGPVDPAVAASCGAVGMMTVSASTWLRGTVVLLKVVEMMVVRSEDAMRPTPKLHRERDTAQKSESVRACAAVGVALEARPRARAHP